MAKILYIIIILTSISACVTTNIPKPTNPCARVVIIIDENIASGVTIEQLER